MYLQRCLNYIECMKTGNLGVFCSIGDASKCFLDLEGCNCQECGVSSDYGFSSSYHCKEDLQRCNLDKKTSLIILSF